MTREARSLARRIIAAAAAALVLLPSALAMGREPEADRVARIALGEWESVTRDSRFVAGIAPRYDISRDRAVVALEPGEATYLAVSAGESLVVDGDREIAPADFTVEWTFGRRLFVSGALSRTPKDARILVLEPDPLRDRTVKIERLASSKDALEVALWIVRARSPRDVTRRMSLDAQGDPIAVDVRDKGDRQDARYFRLEPEHALRFDTRGERRVRVTLRVVWNADDPRVRRLDLELRAGDSTLRRVAVRATPLTTRHVLVDGRPRIASVEHAFEIELPNDASEIEVTSTAAALVRADAIIEDPVLLDSFKLYGRDASLDPLLAPRAWLEKARPALARFGVSLEDPVTIDRVIDVLRDLSTDERYPEASLLSVSLARGLAAAAPVADVRSAARALALEMTSFLALGPNELPLHAGAIEPLRWIAREPLPEGEAPEVRVLSAAKPGELLRGIDRSLFVRLDARGRELEWTLPQRRYPSLARLIVAPVHAESAPAVLLVETDGECKLLRFDPTSPLLSAPARLSIAECGLHLGSPRSAREDVHEIVEADAIELEIPGGGDNVRIALLDGAPVRVALDALKPDLPPIDEESYLSILRSVDRAVGALRLLRQAIAAGAEVTIPSRDARELLTAWRPLLEIFANARARIREERARRVVSVGAIDETSGGPTLADFHAEELSIALPRERGTAPPDSAPSAGGALEARESASASMSGARSVERWLDAARSTKGATRESALLHASAELVAMGERRLAEGALLSLLLGRPSEASAIEALELLDSILAGDSLRRRDLVLGIAAEIGTRSAFALAIEALVDADHLEEAWLLATTVGLDVAPVELVLHASLALDRRRTFKQALERIESPTVREHWIGLEALRSDEIDRAMASLLRAGSRGKPWIDAIESVEETRDAQRIGSAHVANDRTVPAAALPGPTRFVANLGLVREAQGFRLVGRRDSSRDSLYALSTHLRPLRCEVEGPARVRLSARVVLPAGGAAPDTWLLVEGDGWERRVPVTNVRALPDLAISGELEKGLTQRYEATLEIGPGIHSFRATVPGHAALFRTYREEGEFPITLDRHIPSASDSVEDGATPPFARARHAVPSHRATIVLLDSNGSATTELSVEREILSPLPKLDSAAEGVSRSIAIEAADPIDDSRGASELSSQARRAHIERGAKRDPHAVQGPAGEVFGALHHQDFRAILDRPAPADPEARLAWLEALLWIAEADADLAFHARTLGEDVADRSLDIDGVASLRARFARGLRWRRVLSIERSAGVRLVEPAGGIAETPRGRALYALIGDVKPDERSLDPGENALLFANASVSRRVGIGLRVARPAGERPAPTEAIVYIGDRIREVVVLSARTPERFVELLLPPGDETVRVHRVEPSDPENDAADTMLLYRFVAITSDPEATRIETPLRPELRREHHVATPDEPVIARVRGPGRVRIHRITARESSVEHRFIDRDAATIELHVPPGEPEALYRIFERIPVEEPREMWPPRVDEDRPESLAAPPGLPPGLGELPPGSLPLRLDWNVETTPSSRRLGTWSVILGGSRRRALEEDEDGELRADAYFETRVIHRRRVGKRDLWWRGDLFARARPEDGPSAGGTGKIYYRPEALPALSIEGAATAVFEWVEDAEADPRAFPPWSAGFSASGAWSHRLSETWSHQPRLSVFARHYDVEPGDVRATFVRDQDVYTDYRANHRYGLSVSDTFVWRPWVDGKWTATVSLTTNEDFDPSELDHARLSVAYTQWFRGFEARAFFTVRQYFEDDDRAASPRRHLIGADGSYELWLDRGARLEALASYLFDVERFDSTFFVGLALHWGGEGGLASFAPDELDFTRARDRLQEWSLEPEN